MLEENEERRIIRSYNYSSTRYLLIVRIVLVHPCEKIGNLFLGNLYFEQSIKLGAILRSIAAKVACLRSSFNLEKIPEKMRIHGA